VRAAGQDRVEAGPLEEPLRGEVPPHPLRLQLGLRHRQARDKRHRDRGRAHFARYTLKQADLDYVFARIDLLGKGKLEPFANQRTTPALFFTLLNIIPPFQYSRAAMKRTRGEPATPEKRMSHEEQTPP
jgi:hypothetical protein